MGAPRVYTGMMLRAALLAMVAMAAFGQPLTFEVASVKPSSPASAGPLGPNNAATFSANNMSLKLFMAMAYDVLYVQISGGPSWADSERFDIDAKAARAVTQAQKMAMLGNLLADRFQLKFHREPGTLRAYALIAAKGGPKIHPSKADDPMPVMKPGIPAFRMSLHRFAAILNQYVSNGGEFPAPGVPALVPLERMPVVDRTGLDGDYDITLDMTKTRDWLVVLEQQLGLKLEPRKVSIEMLIIDSAAKPGGN